MTSCLRVLPQSLVVTGLLLCLALAPVASADARALRWQELIPAHLADKPLLSPTIDHNAPDVLTQLSPWGDLAMSELVVPELDGEDVTIAGFIVPLNLTEDNRVDEFLLVPYFGACVHVPPPPVNQIIYVTSSAGLDADRIYEAWQVTGRLAVAAKQSALAQAGYSMRAEELTLYGY
jgi:hypothetical protein